MLLSLVFRIRNSPHNDSMYLLTLMVKLMFQLGYFHHNPATTCLEIWLSFRLIFLIIVKFSTGPKEHLSSSYSMFVCPLLHLIEMLH